MTNRREFIQGGIAVTALAAGVSSARLALAAAPQQSFYKAVIDTRFDASVAFGEEMASRGVGIHSMSGDITAFWQNDLSAQWRSEPVVIAGLTAHGPLFVLERLAWDHGMRVVFRAEHRLMPGGLLEHVAPVEEGALQELASDAQWPAAIAKAAKRWVLNVGRANASRTGPARAADLFGDDNDRLISWVIAPRSAAQSADA